MVNCFWGGRVMCRFEVFWVLSFSFRILRKYVEIGFV